MNKNLIFFLLGIIILAAANSVFVVDQWKQAIVFQFGEAVKTSSKPGLDLKIPFVQNVQYFDNRILNFNLNAEEIQAQDKKRVIVSAFVKYRIANTLKFYQSVGLQSDASTRLKSILDSSLRQVIGQSPLIDLLSGQRVDIMKKIEDIINTKAQRFGIEVIDVRILRADLPKENSDAIYRRMQSDREKEAKEYRAQGAEQSDIIKSEAVKDSKVITATAYKDAQILRGAGDSDATKIYAEAYSKDPAFYDFYKSLDVYKKSFNKDNTKMVLSPDNKFMKFFNGIDN